MTVSRRILLAGVAGGTAASVLTPPFRPVLAQDAEGQDAGAAPSAPATDDGQPFSADWLREQARALSQQPYAAPEPSLPSVLADIDYDRYRRLQFKPAKALWAGTESPFKVQFFHLGFLFNHPVQIHEVVDGAARRVRYAPDMFDLGGLDLSGVEDTLGFAGFRLHYPIIRPDQATEFLVFQGASYFRGIGQDQHYGLSARGLAVDTALATGEEFPDFRAFWLERPGPEATEMVVHALLDSPSVAGAYRFVVRPGRDTEMDVSAVLFPRQAIQALGIAPLTSMFMFAANDPADRADYRPNVHDSEGLAIWNGVGEWLWRPLVNPERLRLSYYADQSPRGFGLLQRDRAFASYQDLESRYERRPSAWVEPVGDWGAGKVALIEIPSASEIHDNIVAFWQPDEPIEPGTEHVFDYRLFWCWEPPSQPNGGQVIGTRTGAGSVSDQPDTGLLKFVVDFAGPPLDEMLPDAGLVPAISASRGEILNPVLMPNPETAGWRAVFDLQPDGDEPVELRCAIQLEGKPLTETWSYQWTP